MPCPRNFRQYGCELQSPSAHRRESQRDFLKLIVARLSNLALAFGLFIAQPVFLEAQGETSWIGKRVVQKRRDFSLRADTGKAAAPQREDEIHFYRATRADGPSLWLEAEHGGASGWAPAENVVAVDVAIEFFTNQIRDRPNDSFPILMRASIWHDRKELGHAMDDYTEAIRLDPRNAALYCNRGYLLGEQGQFDKAIADFTEAIRLDPRDPIAYLHRGHAWSEQHHYDKAIADFTETIRLNPEDAYALRSRGHARADTGDFYSRHRRLHGGHPARPP